MIRGRTLFYNIMALSEYDGRFSSSKRQLVTSAACSPFNLSTSLVCSISTPDLT